MKRLFALLLGIPVLTGCMSNKTHTPIEPVKQVEYTNITKRVYYLSCDAIVNDKNTFLGSMKVSVRDFGQKFQVRLMGNNWIYGDPLTKRNDDGSVSAYDEATGQTFIKVLNSKQIYYYVAIPSRDNLVMHIDCSGAQKFPMSN